MVVAAARGPRKPGTRGRQRRKAERREQPCAADVPGIGDDEAAGLVQGMEAASQIPDPGVAFGGGMAVVRGGAGREHGQMISRPVRRRNRANYDWCMADPAPDLVVLHEHPEWQKPLFAALERRGVAFEPFDVTRAAFSNVEPPRCAALLQPGEPERLRPRPHAGGAAGARLHAIARTAGRARPERRRRVRARAEQERAGDAAAHARHRLRRARSRSTTSRALRALRGRDRVAGAAQAGSGRQRRAHPGGRVAGRRSRRSSRAIPAIWLPDNLFLLQEYLPHDPDQGIVRLEFLGGELLYAMRVKTHGRFNLCPSPVCNPDDGDGVCEVPADDADRAGRVLSVSRRAAATPSTRRRASCAAARLDVGGIEYLETRRRPAGVLRHQRQLEPAPVGRRGVRLRSVRAGRRLYLVAQLGALLPRGCEGEPTVVSD